MVTLLPLVLQGFSAAELIQFLSILFCVCSQRDVPGDSFDRHTAFCARNNILCQKCGDAVRRADYETHMKEQHTKVCRVGSSTKQ